MGRFALGFIHKIGKVATPSSPTNPDEWFFIRHDRHESRSYTFCGPDVLSDFLDILL
jgi:hypothetical protein